MNMDRAIFNINASVEATSLYILLCALMDGGQPPTLEQAVLKWTGTEETMVAAAEELIGRCVLRGAIPVSRQMHLHPNTRDMWC